MSTIKDVEIFREGTHNGDSYDSRDLDDMVTNFHRLDFAPALKIGHSKDSPGAPAYGWVKNLRRVGRKLYADLTDMHDSVLKAIRDRRYDRISAEVYHNLQRDGKDYRRALKAVALLGAEVPAVANLVPLHKMQFAAAGYHHIAFSDDQPLAPSPGEEVDTRVREYRAAHPEVKTYEEAMAAVLAENPKLAREYSMSDPQSPQDMDAQRWRNEMGLPDLREERQSAGIEIQNKVAAEIAKFPGLSNTEALRRVLLAHPGLAAEYRGGNAGSIGSSFDTVMGS